MVEGGAPIFDVSINLGNILTIATFIVGGIVFSMTVKADIRVLNTKIDATDESNDLRFVRVEAQVDDTKIEVKRLGAVLVEIAKTNGRQDLTDERLLAQGRRLDEQSRLMNELSQEIRTILKDRNAERRD